MSAAEVSAAINTKRELLSFVFTARTFTVDHPKALLSDAETKLREAFLADRCRALFDLGFTPQSGKESPSLSFLHRLSGIFLEELTGSPDLEVAREHTVVTLSEETADRILYLVPFGIGTENITPSWIRGIFEGLNQAFSTELSAWQGTVSMFLTEHSQNLRVPERIFFHLVENRDDPDHPFAFLATYSTRDARGKVRHMPLSYALTEYREDRKKLLDLLSCLNRASEVSPLIASFTESGEMFHPLRLTSEEAWQFLKSVEDIEKCGIVCRVPNWWKRGASSVSLSVQLGGEKPSLLGFDSIVSSQPSLSVDGVPLTREEIEELLKSTEGLAFLKGRWVEVNHAKLERMLEEMDQYRGSMTLLEALRLENGMEKEKADPDGGVLVTNGKWLGDLLQNLRRPKNIKIAKVPAGLHAALRPYQKTGYAWLSYMHTLGFGACLADDMGLGKTLQVLTFLESLWEKDKNARVLLVVPASLPGNWTKEAARFVPDLPLAVLHGKPREEILALLGEDAAFLYITTYGMVSRMEEFSKKHWDVLILDEAQAIKNPGTKQTRNIKKIPANFRIALTGTPVENDLTNLWSLFDFLDKGLLGTSKEFSDFAGSIDTQEDGYQKLRGMVSPFILRRLKTDKSIVPDLPEKLEEVEYVDLTAKQAVLYRRQVKELESRIQDADGIEKKGLVLGTIQKLKQICNHPDQYLGQSAYDPAESGKFRRLGEICQKIYERRERVLVFTQYREITPYLASNLEEVFGLPGLVIHGGVPSAKRQQLVDQFNGEEYVPFMVLSVKAAGTGLNLTAANHVIHFDRWWNPAVENQATDRAFRIGQTKNVVVHKFVAAGTIEEKIDQLINDKKELAENVIGSGENWLTKLDDRALLNLMRLE
ncbi:MAG: DEAD/DEAH box helicase [Lachnospiraceae bacterium]|jgi:non-specific serine/threonine protein kinase|nr:DEAD/DEAH box helicase [Lachnospiraceae bacterium]MCI1397240.1 DEAD/DEAH box helicase [Lachnospiraceae bacterium]MCI1422686.1 DEAD/DEAH box helicase [Lachnospiraceae bacterium]MCI1451678.1 DEAD/DEAH box helicase [Lachnospiraceae bacterium]